jgi:hypothetical protein
MEEGRITARYANYRKKGKEVIRRVQKKQKINMQMKGTKRIREWKKERKY